MGTRRRRSAVVAAAAIACSAVAVLGAAFSWVGGGADDDWTTCGNWSATGIPAECYPSETGDDATLPVHSGGWDVTLDTNVTMGVLTIEEDVDFTGAPASTVLDVTRLLIDADAGEVVLTMTAGELKKD